MSKRIRFFLAGLLLAAAASALTIGASAQNLQKFVVKGTKTEISIDTAMKIAQAVQDYAAHHTMANGSAMHVTMVIVGPEGNVVHAFRMDQEHANNGQTALKKAQTSLAFRMPTKQLENMYYHGTVAQREFLEQTVVDGNLAYPVSGGQPIVVDGQIIGAIGMGGCLPACDDLENYALTTVLGPQPPVTEMAPELERLPPPAQPKP